MRYSVDDDFAIELSQRLYNLLADKGQPLARAVGMAVKELTAGSRFPAAVGGDACAVRRMRG